MSSPLSDLATSLLAELAWVRRLARRLVADDADDLTQDVAALTLEHPPRAGGLRAWLGAVTRRRAARWHRDRHRRQQIEDASTPPSRSDDPADAVARLQLQQILAQSVLDLAEPYRAVIVARFFDDRSPTEIARQSGVPAATVRQQLHRGLAMLRARLERDRGTDWRAAVGGLAVPRTAAATAIGGLLMTPKLLLATGMTATVLLGSLWVFGSGRDSAPPAAVGALIRAVPPASSAAATTPATSRVAFTSATRERFELLVVTSGGRPIGDARVLLDADGQVLDRRTDRNGLTAFDSDASPATVLVIPGDRPPALRQVGARRGRETIVLPDGELVAGRVTVIDRPLAKPVRLELRVGPHLEARLTKPLEAWLAHENVDLRLMTTRTDVGGAFTFAGLVPTSSGTLGVPLAEPYWLRPQESSLPVLCEREARLPRPMTGIALSLTQLPTVRGRIVWGDSSVATGAGINARVEFAGGGHSAMIGAGIDAHGRFEVGFASSRRCEHEAWLDPKNHKAIARLVMSLWHPDARQRPQHEWLATELGADLDVGDLVLERAPALHVVVRDTDDKPIAAARLEGRMPALTSADGRGVVLVAEAGQRTFRIGAPGCLVEHYAATNGTGTEADPLRFTLRRGNRLTVRVQPAELAFADLRVELHSTSSPFTAPEKMVWWPSPMHVAAGSTQTSHAGTHADGSGNALFDLSDTGLVTFASLVPDVPVRLRVLDRIGAIVAERPIRLPGPEEREEVEFATRDRAATIDALVTLDGAPLANATIDPLGSTDASGHASIRLLASMTPIELKIDHPSAVRLTTGLVLQPGTQRPHFELSRGHELEVRVVDATGTAVDAMIVAPTDEHSDLGPGHVRFRRLPANGVTVSATVDKGTFERTVDPSTQAELVIRVPAR